MKLSINEIKPNQDNPRTIKDDKFKKFQIIDCLTCGLGFTSNKNCSTRTPKYCSVDCYAESLRKYKSCKQCKKVFANYKNTIFCSKDCQRTYTTTHAENPTLRAAKYRHRRRTLLSKPIDTSFLARLLNVQGNKCFYCNMACGKLAVEHLTPVSKHGDNDNYNLVYSCKSCNSRKRDKTLEQWAIQTKNLWWLDKFDYIYSGAL